MRLCSARPLFALVLLVSCTAPNDQKMSASPPPEKRSATPASASPTPAPTPAASSDVGSVATAKDLRLVVRRYDWETGGYFGVIVEAGALTVVWEKGEMVRKGKDEYMQPFWLKRTVALSEADEAKVRSAIDDADFFALDPLYKNPDVHDGYSDNFRVRAHGKIHTVTCANETPAAIRAIEAVLAPLRDQAKTEGERMDSKEMEAFWKDQYAE